MQFTDDLRGRFFFWVFKKFLKGQSAVYNHDYRELMFFKKELET